MRFDNLLGRVPHRQSLGFGGQAGGVGSGGQAGGVTDHDFDRGLVQKLILVLLKCVALTTREARYGTGTQASQIIIYSSTMVGTSSKTPTTIQLFWPIFCFQLLDADAAGCGP